MARSHTIETGWTHPETEEDFRVTLSMEPGEEPSFDSPGCGPAFDVESVREDKPGGVSRPDLIAIVEAELSGGWGDEVAAEAQDDERGRYEAAMEDRRDAEREERMHGGRP